MLWAILIIYLAVMIGIGVYCRKATSTVNDFVLPHARIVFQGVEGAYSQQAMTEYFGKDCDSFHVETWKDAMEVIKNGDADFAVLPIENSTAGIVSENYDLLVEYDNYIVGDQVIQIKHALLGRPEAQIEDITTVYSHPQALMQCSDFLYEHSNWEKISLKNTAVSAKKVMEDGDRTHAAIASTLTAELYGLKVLDVSIKNFDFSAEYNASIEKKTIAEQNALTAKQELEISKAEAEKKKVEAQGEAEANKIKEQTITDKILVQQWIEKWDGKLPTVSGDSTSMIDINELLK